MKRGSSKYKYKIPFKPFNFHIIGHFASKCPYKKCDDNDDEEEHESIGKHYRHERGK